MPPRPSRPMMSGSTSPPLPLPSGPSVEPTPMVRLPDAPLRVFLLPAGRPGKSRSSTVMSGAASSEGIPKSCFLAKSSAAFGSLPTLPLFSFPGFWLDDIGSLLYTPPVHVSSVSRHGASGSGEFGGFAVEHVDHIADHP